MLAWISKLSLPASGALLCLALVAAVAEPAPEVFTRPVIVLVTDEAGVPIPGVNIHRSVWTKEHFPPNADYTTNDKGGVVFGVPHEVSILRLWATKEGWVPKFANFDARKLKGDPVPLEYAFRLAKGTTIGGYVRDESGAPIAGAKVEVRIIHARDSAGIGEAVVDTWLAFGSDSRVTDEHGFWSLNNVPAGDGWKIGLRLRHPDHVDDLEWRGLQNIPPYTLDELRGQSAKLVMERGVRVSGTIRDPAGKPLVDAMVVWGDHPYDNSNVQEAFTGNDGHYRLPPLATGSIALTIIAPGFSPELKTVDLDGESVTADLQMRLGKTIAFQFVDADGKPLSDVTVNIAGWRRMKSLFNWRHSNVPYSKIPDKADGGGHYEWTWAPEDEVEFTFSKKGYAEMEPVSFGPGTHRYVLNEKSKP